MMDLKYVELKEDYDGEKYCKKIRKGFLIIFFLCLSLALDNCCYESENEIRNKIEGSFIGQVNLYV